MPFIGNQPALSYTSFAKQDFTTSATTSYTLDHPVTNENEIALFINFVRQEPTTAYTASGTSLTLTSATSGTDDMYCVFLGKAVQTVNPPAGSVGASQISDGSIALGKLSATGTKDATTFLRGDNSFSALPASGIISSNYASSVSSTTTTSTSFIDTYSPGISVTPASTSSKFLVISSGCILNTNNSFTNGLTIFRDSTNLASTTADDGDMVLIEYGHHNFCMVDLDEPNTTSQITYKMKYRTTNASAGARINPNNTQSQLVVIEF